MKIGTNKQGFTTATLTTVYDRELTLTKPNHYDVLWMNREHCNHSTHLTREMAGELAKQLAYFARTGKLKSNDPIFHEQKRYNLVGLKYCLKSNKTDIFETFYLVSYATNEGLSEAIDNARHKQIELNLKYLYIFSEPTVINSVESTILEQVIKWLSEGQEGFYTPNGLVKEL